MSRHILTPKPAYASYQIVVGWDRPLGTYYAQVINFNADEPRRSAVITAVWRWIAGLLHLPAALRPAEPVFIWLGADGTPITHATEVIRAVAPYALIPKNLGLALALDQLNEGNRRFLT